VPPGGLSEPTPELRVARQEVAARGSQPHAAARTGAGRALDEAEAGGPLELLQVAPRVAIRHPELGRRPPQSPELFVKTETSDGLCGWGECYTQADRDQSIVAHVRQLARYLVGRDAGHIRHFTHWAYHDFAGKRGAMDFWSAVSGLEQALWDLAGKRLGVPVVSLLGGACRGRLRVYANGWSFGAKTPDAYAAKAKETVARGFTALKFDPFPGPWRTHISRETEQQVVETVRAVRDAVGPKVDLLIEV